ncbi:MAG: ABC transporter ATP-binding protein [Chloroflexi bacterium]|nr:ABC transporter ATP-binding protein [Chloroflexota bacterium]MBI2979408.1 ABC transporter ATP-binding protein [Chloroflexota bacterium]
MSRVAVRCQNVSKRFGQTPAVNGINLELTEGSFLALLGPSGCGKTTLLRLIAGLETPDHGTIEVDGKFVSAPGLFVPPEKRRVGIVFQDYALFPHLSVADNIAYGLARSADRRARVEEMLSLVGMRNFQKRMPHELSGGEQQRVAIARALAPAPEVLLLDEPFSNLDADLRSRIRNEVKDILAYARATVIFVTHDQEEALFMGDRVGVMNRGQLEQFDRPEAIFHTPATPFVAQFVGTADFLSGKIENGSVATEVGKLPIYDHLPSGMTVKAMIRPDYLDINPAADGLGEIIDRVFQGMHYLYRVRLPSGATIRSLQHHTRDYPVGERVSFHMNSDHAVTCFESAKSNGDGMVGIVRDEDKNNNQ